MGLAGASGHRLGLEYLGDASCAQVVFSGTAAKFPEIPWIFSHSGGTLPFLAARFEQQQKVQKLAHLKDGPVRAFQKFYCELAQGHSPAQIAALLKMVDVSQLL